MNRWQLSLSGRGARLLADTGARSTTHDSEQTAKDERPTTPSSLAHRAPPTDGDVRRGHTPGAEPSGGQPSVLFARASLCLPCYTGRLLLC